MDIECKNANVTDCGQIFFDGCLFTNVGNMKGWVLERWKKWQSICHCLQKKGKEQILHMRWFVTTSPNFQQFNPYFYTLSKFLFSFCRFQKKKIHCYSVKHISGPVPFSGDMKLMTMKMTRLRRTKTDFLLLFHNKNICLISFIESKCSQHLFIAHIFNIWSSRPVT